MIKSLFLVGAVTIGLFSGTFIDAANADVRVKVKKKFYTVTGKTGALLYKSILKRGPKAFNTQHAIATTQYGIKFRTFEAGIVGSKCKVTKVNSDITLTYTYPKWKDYKRASPALRKSWDKFYGYLVKHEEKHGAIYIKGTKDLERQLKRASGRVSNGCAGLETSMDRRVEPLLRRIHARQVRFDRRESSRFSRITRAELKLLRGK